MGSKSSSRQATTNTTNNIVPTASGDNSNAYGLHINSVDDASSVSVNVTDGESVKNALNFATDSIQVFEGLASSTLDIADNTFGTAFGIVERSRDKTIEAVNDAAVRTVTAVQQASASTSEKESKNLNFIITALVGVTGVAILTQAFKK